MTDWPPPVRGLPVGGQPTRSWRAAGQGSSSSAAASASQGQRTGHERRHGDDGAKSNYLDVPPSWSGENPDKLLQTYLKAAE
eukprot:2797301-Amphidinium_carterae.1